MSAPQNPFAFPQALLRHYNGQVLASCEQHCDYGGMELRDYFAAQAMHAMLSSDEWAIDAAADAPRIETCHVAAEAYVIADAMLQARANDRAQSSVTDPERRALDNIPEFGEDA